MALKDYKWKLEGIHKVYEDLEIKDATVTIVSVHYTAETRRVINEVCFVESDGIIRHVRSFMFTLPEQSHESISAENIADFIQQNFPDAILITPENNA